MERYSKLLQLLRDIKVSYGIIHSRNYRIDDLYIKQKKFDELCRSIKDEIIYIHEDRTGNYKGEYAIMNKYMNPFVYGYCYDESKKQYRYY